MAQFRDEAGATRHSLATEELQELYKKLENFIADSTAEEVLESKEALIQVKTMIHQRIRKNNKNDRANSRTNI